MSNHSRQEAIETIVKTVADQLQMAHHKMEGRTVELLAAQLGRLYDIGEKAGMLKAIDRFKHSDREGLIRMYEAYEGDL